MTSHSRPAPSPLLRFQSGVALLVALIMLIVLSLLALSAVRFSALEVRMSSNDELSVEAFQKAVSIVDATIANPDNTPVTGNAGYTVCTSNQSGCNAYTITLPDGFESDSIANGNVTVKTVQTAVDAAPPRAIGTSITGLAAAMFRIEGRYDYSDEGLGRDEVHEGLILLYPKGGN